MQRLQECEQAKRGNESSHAVFHATPVRIGAVATQRCLRSCASARSRNGANARPVASTRGVRLAERRELRHLQARIAAGIDALERLEVHVHVEREAVIAGAAADAQADARDLAAVDVHAGRVLAALGGDAEAGAVVDDGAFQRGDEVAHAEAGAADVDEWIDDELAGAVIGDLPAAIDLAPPGCRRRRARGPRRRSGPA